MARLMIFDLDGTIVCAPDFYRQVYSGTLTGLVEELRGQEGLKVLADCRKNYGGKGELALFALNIPFAAWAERLIAAPLNLLEPQPDVVAKMRALNAIKVVYTGSPLKMAKRVLARVGFLPDDFHRIIGWVPGEMMPLKWTSSSFVFDQLLAAFRCKPFEAWAVGDDPETDLFPAASLGVNIARIGKPMEGPWFRDIEAFIAFVRGEHR